MLFRKKRSLTPLQSENDVLIAAGVRSHGAIDTNSDVHIDGSFSGSINSSGLLEIGKNGRAKAEINARAIIIDGFLQGKAYAKEEIAVHNSAEVQAELQSSTLVVDKNALVSGMVRVVR
ncbi:polymer-forming cytoskeletal protein [Candidatus Saccharibacteria bacterium]|nr:polymer-forming cytoskeletal protein [Candidatus Saccharibacteria bacterium]